MNTNVKTTDELNAMSVDEMLQLGIEDVADLEGFRPYPTALYSFVVKACGIENVGAEDKPTIQLETELTSCDELDNEADADQLPEEFPAKYKENFFLDTDKRIGLRGFITITRPLAVANGWTNIQEIMEGMVGFTGKALIKKGGYYKKTPDGSKGEYQETNNIDTATVLWD
jgi:hypothetical protein